MLLIQRITNASLKRLWLTMGWRVAYTGRPVPSPPLPSPHRLFSSSLVAWRTRAHPRVMRMPVFRCFPNHSLVAPTQAPAQQPELERARVNGLVALVYENVAAAATSTHMHTHTHTHSPRLSPSSQQTTTRCLDFSRTVKELWRNLCLCL